MFSLSYFTPCEVKGTIRLNRKPHGGLGVYEDVEGKRWDIIAIFGKKDEYYVCAVPLKKLHPYYKDTSTFSNYGVVSQTWYPYKVEVVGESKSNI